MKHPSTALPPLDPQQRYTLDEAQSYLREGRTRLFAKISAGEIRTIKDGRRTYIPGSEIARLSRAPEPVAA